MDRAIGIDPVHHDPSRWEVRIDGEEIQNLQARKISTGDVTEEEWENIRDTSAATLSQCPIPSSSGGRATGLALGKVQSGKTLSYTALTALAVDNGYRITVVLAGTKNPLLEQNYTRLCNDLEAISRPTLTAFKNPVPQEADVIHSVLLGGGHALIVVLKNRMRIDNVRRVLSTPELREYPTLVIDDEGDEASLNTQFRRNRRSAIYDSIIQLRDALQLHAYIAYTATPQANLLIDGIDGLSPDFGILVQPGGGYCGGSVFFGNNRDRYVRLVPIEEADNEHYTGVPEGIRQAIATFLVGGAIRHLRQPLSWHSMLIHNSNLRANHEQLQSDIRNLISLWRETLALPDTDPAAAELLIIFHAAYDDLCATVQSPPSWDEIRRQLNDEIRLEVWMVNSLPLGRDPVGTPFRLPNNILVGGNMLGRGVTIPGLSVTYITRRAQQETNADTMEQRARWFGYKQFYLDICRIFLTAQLRDDYTELLIHEDDFWDALTRNQRQGLSIREWPRMFRLDMNNLGIRPTRQNVASFRQFQSRGWEIQRHPVENAEIAGTNIAAINRFFSSRHLEPRRYGHVQHEMLSQCPVGEIIQGLLSQINTDGTDWENSYEIEYLARLLVDNRLQNIDVLLMAREEDGLRKRTKRDGAINPMQGHDTHRDASNPDYYLGDEYIHNNQPQLQIHLIRLEGEDLAVPVPTHALALYIPGNNPRYDLAYVVRGEEQ